MSDVTRILSQIESGDPSAAEQLLGKWNLDERLDLIGLLIRN